MTAVALLCMALGPIDPTDTEPELPVSMDLVEELPPMSLAEPAKLGPDGPRLSIGLHVGWFQMNEAEDGEVYYGLHARFYFLRIFAVEGSIDFAEQEFEDDDVTLSTVPVQLTGMLMPFQGLPVRPYGLIGLGWYFHDVEYSGNFNGLDDDSDSTLGVHLGLGLELLLGDLIMLHADLRYVFLDDPDLDDSVDFDSDDFNFWTVAFGAAIAF